nr:hypothetical protein [Kitasatospora sp. NA04385]
MSRQLAVREFNPALREPFTEPEDSVLADPRGIRHVEIPVSRVPPPCMSQPLPPELVLTRQHPRLDEQRQHVLVHLALEPHRQREPARRRPATLTLTRCHLRLSAAPGGPLAGLLGHGQGLDHVKLHVFVVGYGGFLSWGVGCLC